MTGFVTSVAFDPVGNRVLAASIDGRVGAWECHQGPVNAVTVDAAAEVVLTAGHDRSAAVWHVGDGRLVRRVGGLAAGALDAVAVGGRLAVAGFDGSITVWDALGEGDAVVLTGHGEAVTALHALDAGTLVSGSRDRTVRVWDLATGRDRVLGSHGFWVTRVRPAGAHDIVSAGEDGAVIRWAWPSGVAAWRCDAIGEPIWGLGCDTTGRRAVAGAAGATWVVDLAGGTADRLADLDGETFRGVAFAPDDRTVALGGDRGRLLLYDLDARAVRMTLEEPVPDPLSLAVSGPDRGVVGRADGAVELVAGGTRVVVDDAHKTFVYSARRLAADRFATGGFDGVVRLWNLATGERARLDYGSEVFALSADAAGRRLVAAGGNRVVAWDLATGAEVWARDEGGDPRLRGSGRGGDSRGDGRRERPALRARAGARRPGDVAAARRLRLRGRVGSRALGGRGHRLRPGPHRGRGHGRRPPPARRARGLGPPAAGLARRPVRGVHQPERGGPGVRSPAGHAGGPGRSGRPHRRRPRRHPRR